jgi:hypothetical protein
VLDLSQTISLFSIIIHNHDDCKESEGPQWVQCKALVRVQVEAPQPILDLVNFDLLLRVFPNFKIVSFKQVFNLSCGRVVYRVEKSKVLMEDT